MRTDSRWSTSAGEKPRPNATSQATPTRAAAPSRRVARSTSSPASRVSNAPPHSSMSGPKASVPPAPKATANTATTPTQGQPSAIAVPPVPSAASTARVAPIRTGATTGSKQQREQGLPPPCAGSEAAVERTDRSQADGGGHPGRDEQHDARPAHLAAVEQHRGEQEQRLEHGQLDGERERLAPEQRRGVDAGGAQRVEGAVLGLHGERALDEHQQAEQGGQPDQTGGHRLEQRPGAAGAAGRRSRAKANITITMAANGSTWLSATRLRHSMRRSLPATSSAVRTALMSHRSVRRPSVAGSGQRRPAWPGNAVIGPGRRRRRRSGWPANRPAPARGWRRPRSRRTPPPGAAWRRARRGRRRRGRRAARRAATAAPAGRPGTPSAVRRCWPAERRRTGSVGEPAGEAEAVHRRRRSRPASPRPSPPRTGRSRLTVQVEVEAVAVAEQPDAAADLVALGGQVAAEHGARAAGESAAARHRRAAAWSCRRRWARAAGRSRRGDVSVDAGQRREPAEHGDHTVELDDGRAGGSTCVRPQHAVTVIRAPQPPYPRPP